MPKSITERKVTRLSFPLLTSFLLSFCLLLFLFFPSQVTALTIQLRPWLRTHAFSKQEAREEGKGRKKRASFLHCYARFLEVSSPRSWSVAEVFFFPDWKKNGFSRLCQNVPFSLSVSSSLSISVSISSVRLVKAERFRFSSLVTRCLYEEPLTVVHTPELHDGPLGSVSLSRERNQAVSCFSLSFLEEEDRLDRPTASEKVAGVSSRFPASMERQEKKERRRRRWRSCDCFRNFLRRARHRKSAFLHSRKTQRRTGCCRANEDVL